MTEELKISVGEMLKTTGANTARFMEQVAGHVEMLENEVKRLQARVADMEAQHQSEQESSPDAAN